MDHLEAIDQESSTRESKMVWVEQSKLRENIRHKFHVYVSTLLNTVNQQNKQIFIGVVDIGKNPSQPMDYVVGLSLTKSLKQEISNDLYDICTSSEYIQPPVNPRMYSISFSPIKCGMQTILLDIDKKAIVSLVHVSGISLREKVTKRLEVMSLVAIPMYLEISNKEGYRKMVLAIPPLTNSKSQQAMRDILKEMKGEEVAYEHLPLEYFKKIDLSYITVTIHAQGQDPSFHFIEIPRPYTWDATKNTIARMTPSTTWTRMLGTNADQQWQLLAEKMHFFQPPSRMMLISGCCDLSSLLPSSENSLMMFAEQPWSLVLDFDADSENEDRFSHNVAKARNQTNPGSLIKITHDTAGTAKYARDKMNWYFVRGITGETGMVSLGQLNLWRREYLRTIEKEIDTWFDSDKLLWACVLILWPFHEDGMELKKFLKDVISRIHMQPHQNIVLVTDNENYKGSFEEEFIREQQVITVLQIPLNYFFSKFNEYVSVVHKDRCVKQIRALESKERDRRVDIQESWLKAAGNKVELLYIDIGNENASEDDLKFHLGAPISWCELKMNVDVERGRKQNLKTSSLNSLRSSVQQYNGPKVWMIHGQAGSGRTTLARRLIFEMIDFCPCAVLKEYSDDIIQLIMEINTAAGPLLLLVDEGSQESSFLDHIVRLIHQSIQLVVLYIPNTTGGRVKVPFAEASVLWHGKVQSHFDQTELQDLANKLKNQYPDSINAIDAQHELALEGLKSFTNTHDETYLKDAKPFLMFLQVNRLKHEIVRPFVMRCLKTIENNPDKLFMIRSIAFVHYFGDNAEFPTRFFEQKHPLNEQFTIEQVFSNTPLALELLTPCRKTTDNKYDNRMCIHIEIAKEILIQCAEKSGILKLPLANVEFGKQFAEYTFSIQNALGEKDKKSLANLLIRVFIDQNRTFIGTNESTEQSKEGNLKKFSKFIQETSHFNKQQAVEVFMFLCNQSHRMNLLERSAHFWAHLGRYKIYVMDLFEEALEAIENALGLAKGEEQSKPSLLHIKGMIYRQQIYSRFKRGGKSNDENINLDKNLKDMIEWGRLAADAFDQVEQIDPYNTYCVMAQLKLRLYCLEVFCSWFCREKTKRDFQSPEVKKKLEEFPSGRWLIDCPQKIQILLTSDLLLPDDQKKLSIQFLKIWGDLRDLKASCLKIISNSQNSSDHVIPLRTLVWAEQFNESKKGNVELLIYERLPKETINHIQRNIEQILYTRLDTVDVLTWLRVIRVSDHPVSLSNVLLLVTEWQRKNPNIPEANFYSYLLCFLDFLNTKAKYRLEEAEKYFQVLNGKLMKRARSDVNEDSSILSEGDIHYITEKRWKKQREWFILKDVNAEWTFQHIRNFYLVQRQDSHSYKDIHKEVREGTNPPYHYFEGRVVIANYKRHGKIKLKLGINQDSKILIAVFAPEDANPNLLNSKNIKVKFALSFSMQGLYAWNVYSVDESKPRDKPILTTCPPTKIQATNSKDPRFPAYECMPTPDWQNLLRQADPKIQGVVGAELCVEQEKEEPKSEKILLKVSKTKQKEASSTTKQSSLIGTPVREKSTKISKSPGPKTEKEKVTISSKTSDTPLTLESSMSQLPPNLNSIDQFLTSDDISLSFASQALHNPYSLLNETTPPTNSLAISPTHTPPPHEIYYGYIQSKAGEIIVIDCLYPSRYKATFPRENFGYVNWSDLKQNQYVCCKYNLGLITMELIQNKGKVVKYEEGWGFIHTYDKHESKMYNTGLYFCTNNFAEGFISEDFHCGMLVTWECLLPNNTHPTATNVKPIVEEKKNHSTFEVVQRKIPGKEIKGIQSCIYGKNCKEGKKCNFHHSSEDKEYFAHNNGVGKPNRKVELCDKFARRSCNKTKVACEWAHGECDAWCLKCKTTGHFTSNCPKKNSK